MKYIGHPSTWEREVVSWTEVVNTNRAGRQPKRSGGGFTETLPCVLKPHRFPGSCPQGAAGKTGCCLQAVSLGISTKNPRPLSAAKSFSPNSCSLWGTFLAAFMPQHGFLSR